MNSSALQPGMKVLWHHVMRGGYGYSENVPAEVVAVLPKWVRIRVQKRDGTFRETQVKAHNLELDKEHTTMESATRPLPNTANMPPLPGQEPAFPAPEPVSPAPPDLAPQAGESAPLPLITAVSPIVTIPALPEAVAEPPKPLCDWWGKPITPGPLAGRSYPGIDLAWDGYEEETAWYEAAIANLRHQLRNSEQAASFAADLLKKEGTGAREPSAASLRDEARKANSYLIPFVGPARRTLLERCECIANLLEAKQHQCVALESKLMALQIAYDDLVKAGPPAAAQ